MLANWRMLIFQSYFTRNPVDEGNGEHGLVKASLNSEGRVAPTCVFCQVSANNGFDVLWENEGFIAFRDHNPSATQHIQVIPKQHIDSVKSLSNSDVNTIRQMRSIGHYLLDDLGVLPGSRRLGFHIPPFNSVNHLHMHVQALPYRSFAHAIKYFVARGRDYQDKGFGWFSTADQTISILEKGRRVGVFPC